MTVSDRPAGGLTPHGPEFSFVDRCDLDPPNRRAVAVKTLDPESPFFAGHFPGRPMMPGVLQVECAAQAAGILWRSLAGSGPKTPLFLAQVLQFRFVKPVLPGQTLQAEVVLEREFGSLARFDATLRVDGETVARGSLVLSR